MKKMGDDRKLWINRTEWENSKKTINMINDKQWEEAAQYINNLTRKEKQKIFIARENLSSYTTSQFIEDETADSLRAALISSVTPMMPKSGCKVSVDPSSAFQTLAT